MQVDLTQEDRKLLIQGILDSDMRYFKTLVDRKYKLLLELQLLESSMQKKAAEIEIMETQLQFVDTYQ